MSKYLNLKISLGWTLVSIVPLIYYVYVLRLALNLPIGDDFVVILNYLMRSDTARTWSEKWHELSFQFIEHRLIFSRLSAQLIRLVWGQLDFRGLILLGNLCLLGVAGLLCRTLRLNGFSVWYLLPVVLLVFQPIAYESHFWALSATNYMPVCLFGMLSFYGLQQSRRPGFIMAWAMAVVATYTFGNGLLVWPVGALLLLVTRRWRMLIVWLISTLFIIWAFYNGHNYRPHPSMIDNLRDRLAMVIANFFLLVGACFNPADTVHPFGRADLPALVVGVIITLILVVTGLLLILKYIRPNGTYPVLAGRLFAVPNGLFLGATLLFLLLSCAAFAAGRSTVDAVVTDSRYRDFSVFTSVVAYCMVLLALHPAHRRLWLGIALGGSLLFCVSSYMLYTPRLQSQNADFKSGAYNWHHNRHWLIYKGASYFDTVADRVSDSLEMVNWYHIPTYFVGEPTISTRRIKAPDSIDPNDQVAYWRLPTDPIGADQPYFRVQHGRQHYLLAIKRPTSLTSLLRTGSALGPYFITDFPYGQLMLPGQWTIGVFLESAHTQLNFSPPLVLNVRSR